MDEPVACFFPHGQIQLGRCGGWLWYDKKTTLPSVKVFQSGRVWQLRSHTLLVSTSYIRSKGENDNESIGITLILSVTLPDFHLSST